MDNSGHNLTGHIYNNIYNETLVYAVFKCYLDTD